MVWYCQTCGRADPQTSTPRTSSDKDRVLKEAFRVLKPGGRFAVSDVVVRGHLPAEIKKSLEFWAGCVAGALSEEDYLDKLAKAGFNQVDIEATRVYYIDDARSFSVE
jgi:ubiquinone/menaquinone biosynthesis C-methylase UbiE